MKSRIRSVVRSLSAYVPGEQPSGGAFIKLNTNENPYPPSPAVLRALAGFDGSRLRLYPDPDSRVLRERIGALHGFDPSRVFVGNGSDEILALCTRAFVEDTGSIGYFVPSYSLYPVLADIQDVEKRPVELGPEFEWRMPSEYECSLFFLTNPNAPTGMLHSRKKVAEFCRNFDGVVVIDEAYVDFAGEDCVDLARECENVLVARTFSKSHSLAGLRVGYAVGHEALIAALFKVKDSYNLSAISQALALAALSDVDAMRANAKRIVATRERLSGTLTEMGFKVYPSAANFVWVEPRGMAAKDLFERLRERRIVVRYFPGKRTAAFLRITVGTDPDVDALLKAIRDLSGGGIQ